MHSEDYTDKTIWQGAIAWMVRNNVAANILMAAMLIGGAILLFNTKQEVMPEFQIDQVSISISLPGASPEEVEKGVVLAIEETIRSVEGVDTITSRINTGRATITVEAIEGINRDKFLQDIQNTVNRISTFPQEAEKPIITLSSRIHEVLTLVLSGSDDPQFLREWAENIKDELLQQPNITQVALDGVQKKEIQIEISQETLRRYGLTLNNIATVIKNASVEQGAGTLETRDGDIIVKISDRRDYANEFEQIPIISNADGSRILLEDLGTVKETFADRKSWAEFKGTPSILIDVYRIGEETPDIVSKDSLKVIEKMNKIMPGNLRLDALYNDADEFNDRAGTLTSNALTGIILVFLCLALFLEPKLAFWVSLGIPVSIVGSFLLLQPNGISINMMSMFAFILTLGIVVDDAIVVGENVHIWRRRGYTRPEAAVLGTKEIAVPIIFSVLTNMVAFVPIMFIPGFMGMMFGTVVPVVNAVFICSLIESLFVLPCHLAHDKKPKIGGMLFRISARQRKFSLAFTHWVHRHYGPWLNTFLNCKYVVVAVCVGLLILSGGFLASGRMGMEIMPRMQSDFAFAEVVMPTGTSKERLIEVRDILYQAAEKIIEENGGDTLSRGIYINVRSSSIQARIYLVSADLRKKTTNEITAIWQKEVGQIEGVETINFMSDRGGPGSGKSLSVRLAHKDSKILEEAAEALATEIRHYPNVRDIDTGMSKQNRELSIQLTPLAEQLGLTSRFVGEQIRASFEGVTALRQQRGRDEITVRLRLPEEERVQESSFHDLIIRTPNNTEVLLRDIVKTEDSHAYASIRRTDGQRTLDVTGNVLPRSESGRVLDDINTNILPELASRFPGLTWTNSGMQKDIDNSMSALYLGLVLVLLAIYVLLAIPFKSYIQPFIIMVSIPFGIVGSIVGHVIMGYSMSVISFMGVLALCGLVVNDALMLIDFANKEQLNGLSPHDAMHKAGIRRFRPILLTTLTTFIGLAPMILGNSRQAQQLIPVAISLGFGVLFATVITLALVPALYMIVEDLKKK